MTLQNPHTMWSGFTTKRGMQFYLKILKKRMSYCEKFFIKEPLMLINFDAALSTYGSLLKYSLLMEDDGSCSHTLFNYDNNYVYHSFTILKESLIKEEQVKDMVTTVRNIIEDIHDDTDIMVKNLEHYVEDFRNIVNKELVLEETHNWDEEKLCKELIEWKKYIFKKIYDFIEFIECENYHWAKDDSSYNCLNVPFENLNLSGMEYYEYLKMECEDLVNRYYFEIRSIYHDK